MEVVVDCSVVVIDCSVVDVSSPPQAVIIRNKTKFFHMTLFY